MYIQFNATQSYPPSLPFGAPLVTPYPTPNFLAGLAVVPGHLKGLPTPVSGDSVLDVLNSSTSPNFRPRGMSSLSSPEPYSPYGSPVSSPDSFASPNVASPSYYPASPEYVSFACDLVYSSVS